MPTIPGAHGLGPCDGVRGLGSWARCVGLALGVAAVSVSHDCNRMGCCMAVQFVHQLPGLLLRDAQFPERPQGVLCVDGTRHAKQNDVELHLFLEP